MQTRLQKKVENLLNRNFTASKPNYKWLTYITEIPCSDAKLYLAPVFDCYDGCIVGYQTDTNRQAELYCTAFENACKKTRAAGMILHSDRESQYISGIFRKTLKKHHAVQSMSAPANVTITRGWRVFSRRSIKRSCNGWTLQK